MLVPVEFYTPLEAAILFVKRGWKVILVHGIRPDGSCTCNHKKCRAQGKHPVGRGWQNSILENERQVRAAFDKVPHANYGIPAGPNRVWIVDADSEEDDALAGQRFPWTPLRTVSGSRRGSHRFYRLPPHVDPPKKGKARFHDLGERKGIDLQIGNAHCVGAYSAHKLGNTYIPHTEECMWPPPALDEIPVENPYNYVVAKPREETTNDRRKKAGLPEITTSTIVLSVAQREASNKISRAYMAKVDGAPDGKRANTAYRLACVLVRDFLCTRVLAEELLTDWNARCEKTTDLHVILGSIDSAHRRGQKLYGRGLWVRGVISDVQFEGHSDAVLQAQKKKYLKRAGLVDSSGQPRTTRPERTRSKKIRFPIVRRGWSDNFRANMWIYIREERRRGNLTEKRQKFLNRMVDVKLCGQVECHSDCQAHGHQGKRARPCDDALLCPYCSARAARVVAQNVADTWPEQVVMVIRKHEGGNRKQARGSRKAYGKWYRDKKHRPRWVEGWRESALFWPPELLPYAKSQFPDAVLVPREQAAMSVYAVWESVPQALQAIMAGGAEKGGFQFVEGSQWVTHARQPRTGSSKYAGKSLPWRSLRQKREDDKAEAARQRNGLAWDCCNHQVTREDGVVHACGLPLTSTLIFAPTGFQFLKKQGLPTPEDVSKALDLSGAEQNYYSQLTPHYGFNCLPLQE